MKLVNDWRFVLARSHSMWGVYLGIAFWAVPELIYGLSGVDTNPRVWWLLTGAALLYGALGRVVDQRDRDGTGPMPPLLAVMAIAAALFLLMGMGPYPDKADGAEPPGIGAVSGPPSEADWAAVAVPLVAKWEGLRTSAYLDAIASPPVWTVCYGETRNVGPDDRYTADQCAGMLRKRLREYRGGWHGYLTPTTLGHRLTPERDAAYTSLAYNVGIAGAGRSTATRRLNAGDIVGGCQALGWWNKAGGRVIRGLVNRRANETELCLRGAL